MSSKPVTRIDPGLFAGLEPFPLSIISDGQPATADLVLAGEVGYGQSYGYSFLLSDGPDYRFVTSSADDGFAERALLVDPATGDVYWGNEAALASLGLAGEDLARAVASPVSVDENSARLLIVSGEPDVGGAFGSVARSFVLEARADEPVYSDNAVFRFVNTVSGKYFYTVSEAERDVVLASYPEFKLESATFVADDQAREGWTAVYRFGDTRAGGHLYTASEVERDIILAQYPEYRYEGVGFYVPPPADDGSTTPVYRLSNVDTGAYLFTTDPVEKLFMLLKGGWLDQGVVFHARVPPVEEPAGESSGNPAGESSGSPAGDAGVADTPAPANLVEASLGTGGEVAVWKLLPGAPAADAVAYDTMPAVPDAHAADVAPAVADLVAPADFLFV